MCCFSRDVAHVSSTRIFARALDGDRQALAYTMRFAADESLAMVLPIPVASGAGEDAVSFVDLSQSSSFFTALDAAFPADAGPEPSRGTSPKAATLAVHRVGAFEASFAPTRGDLDRLDARFRLPADTWRALDAEEPRGFVVFKLQATRSWPERWLGRGVRDVHPMAFTFPRRDRRQLFFPTLHVHRGTAPPTALFDHTLYAQLPGRPGAFCGEFQLTWTPSTSPLPGPATLIDTTQGGFRARLSGDLPNRDLFVPLRRRVDPACVERAAGHLFGADASRALALLAPVQGWPGEDGSETRLAALRLLGEGPFELSRLEEVIRRPWIGLREEAVRPSLTEARRARGTLDRRDTLKLGTDDENDWDAFVARFQA